LLIAVAAAALWLHGRWRTIETRRVRELADQRTQHEAVMHEQLTRMEAMLDGMIEGLVVLDAEGKIVRANRAAEQMFRFSRMMVGGTLLQAIRNHEVATLASRAATATTALEHEVRLEGPQPRVLQVSAAALRNPAGAVAGAVLVFHDVTQLRL